MLSYLLLFLISERLARRRVAFAKEPYPSPAVESKFAARSAVLMGRGLNTHAFPTSVDVSATVFSLEPHVQPLQSPSSLISQVCNALGANLVAIAEVPGSAARRASAVETASVSPAPRQLETMGVLAMTVMQDFLA